MSYGGVRQMIEDEDWSPGQIAGVPVLESIHIVKQTIYNHVHAGTTGKLASHMPHALKYTRRCKALRPTKATNIPNRTSIHERPKEADGIRFGDWEMDTIIDSYGHAIVTLTERSTNFILMERLPRGRKAKAVARLLFPYGQTLHTITTDNGSEFAAHQEITKRFSRKVKSLSSCILLIHTPLDRKRLLKTPINSSESTSLKRRILKTSQIGK